MSAPQPPTACAERLALVDSTLTPAWKLALLVADNPQAAERLVVDAYAELWRSRPVTRRDDLSLTATLLALVLLLAKQGNGRTASV